MLNDFPHSAAHSHFFVYVNCDFGRLFPFLNIVRFSFKNNFWRIWFCWQAHFRQLLRFCLSFLPTFSYQFPSVQLLPLWSKQTLVCSPSFVMSLLWFLQDSFKQPLQFSSPYLIPLSPTPLFMSSPWLAVWFLISSRRDCGLVRCPAVGVFFCRLEAPIACLSFRPKLLSVRWEETKKKVMRFCSGWFYSPVGKGYWFICYCFFFLHGSDYR